MVLRKFKKVEDNVLKVIKSYDVHLKGFKSGPKVVDIRDSNVSLIFGIRSGKKKIDLSYGKKPNTPSVQRRFHKVPRIFVKILRATSGDALQGMRRVDVEDVTRIMYLFVLTTLLFPEIGQTIGWAIVTLVEDLERMITYAWLTVVKSTLITLI